MKEAWTGELIGKMHNADVTLEQLGEEIGCSKAYVSMLLNGTRKTKGAKERLETAFNRIVERR